MSKPTIRLITRGGLAKRPSGAHVYGAFLYGKYIWGSSGESVAEVLDCLVWMAGSWELDDKGDVA